MSFLGTIFARITLDNRELKKRATEAKRTITGLNSSMSSLGTTALSVKGIITGLGATMAAFAVKDLWQTAIMIDQMNRAFKAIGGSTQVASEELANIRNVAASLGQEFYSLTDSYKFVAAAAKDTTLEGEHARDIFLAVSEAGTALGLTNIQVKMSLYAISQMISKGTVNAEELRQQLGERLPGAYQAMARALGVTTAELSKMLEQGEVIATEAIPKLAKELHRMYAADALLAADKPIGILNRFKTAWIDLKDELSQGDFTDAATEALLTFTDVFSDAEFQEDLKLIIADLADLAKVLTWISEKAVKAGGAVLGMFETVFQDPSLAMDQLEAHSAGKKATGLMAFYAAYDQAEKKRRQPGFDLPAEMAMDLNQTGPAAQIKKDIASYWDNYPTKEYLYSGMGIDMEGMPDYTKMFEFSERQLQNMERLSIDAKKLSKLTSDVWEPFEADWGGLVTKEQKAHAKMIAEITKARLDHQKQLKEWRDEIIEGAVQSLVDLGELVSNEDYELDLGMSADAKRDLLEWEKEWANTVERMRQELGATLFAEWENAPWNEQTIRATRAVELSRRAAVKDHTDFWKVQHDERVEVATRSVQQVYFAERSAWQEIKDNFSLTMGDMKDAFSGWAVSFSSDLTDMIWESEVTFDKIAESFGRMITQMLIQSASADIVGALFGSKTTGESGLFSDLLGGVFDLFSGGTPFYAHAPTGDFNIGQFGTTAWKMHSGGTAGYAGTRMQVDSSMFHNAPRLHDGLAADEFPAILQKGEEVISKDGPKEIHIHQYIDAMDPIAWEDFVRRNPGPIAGAISENLMNNWGLSNTMRRTT